MARIISAFPGMGKTTFTHKMKDTHPEISILDSDSSKYSWTRDGCGKKIRDKNFPQNYIKHIKDIFDKYDLIFVSSHKAVRDALIEAGFVFGCLYPDKSFDADNYIEERIAHRTTGLNDEKFCDIIKNNFDNWIKEIESDAENNTCMIAVPIKSVQNYFDPFVLKLYFPHYEDMDVNKI